MNHPKTADGKKSQRTTVWMYPKTLTIMGVPLPTSTGCSGFQPTINAVSSHRGCHIGYHLPLRDCSAAALKFVAIQNLFFPGTKRYWLALSRGKEGTCCMVIMGMKIPSFPTKSHADYVKCGVNC